MTRYEAAAKPPRNEADELNDARDDGEMRADSFRSDPRIKPEERSRCREYKEPIFDLGHMVPNAF